MISRKDPKVVLELRMASDGRVELVYPKSLEAARRVVREHAVLRRLVEARA